MHDLISIVTVVAGDGQFPAFAGLVKTLDAAPARRELVVACHSLSSDRQIELVDLINDVPDATLHFLPQAASFEQAALIALDNAIGEKCLIVEADDDLAMLWPAFSSALEEGYDVVVARSEAKDGAPAGAHGWLRRLFLAVYAAMTGVDIDPAIRPARAMTRGAAQYLLSRRDAEMLMKTRTLAAGYATRVVAAPPKRRAPSTPAPSFSASLAKAYRSLTQSFSLPVRGIVWFSLLAAFGNLAYSVYVFVAYLVTDNIAPGWTTQSLQISIGFFVFSVMFAFFGELLISIDRGINYRLRYFVQREVRSSKSTHMQLRNVDYGSIEDVAPRLAERAGGDDRQQ